MARANDERGHEAWALRLLGEIGARSGAAGAAASAAHYREALALAEGLGMRPLAAHAHLGLGTLPGAGGDGSGSAHVATARHMFGALGMTAWTSQADAASPGARP